MLSSRAPVRFTIRAQYSPVVRGRQGPRGAVEPHSVAVLNGSGDGPSGILEAEACGEADALGTSGLGGCTLSSLWPQRCWRQAAEANVHAL